MNNTFNDQAEFERTQNLRQQIRTDVSNYIIYLLVYYCCCLLIQYFCCGTFNGQTDYTSRGMDEPGVANCTRAVNYRGSNSDIPQKIVSN